jgi:hypothetical protein
MHRTIICGDALKSGTTVHQLIQKDIFDGLDTTTLAINILIPYNLSAISECQNVQQRVSLFLSG